MADQQLREQVAWACRILARQGHADFTLGHVSARKSDGTILMKRNGLGLDEITPADILTIDLDGRLVAGQGKVHLEYVIHTEVYKARPDVGSVVHTHPPYAPPGWRRRYSPWSRLFAST
jgi:L-fuculose-phosphate aldolase